MNLVSTPHMDFPAYALMLAKGRGDLLQSVEVEKHDLRGVRPRVELILRSAVNAGTTTDPAWAGNLIDHQLMVAAWAEGLRSISAYDAILPFARPVPLNSAVVVVTSVATASTSDEAGLKPITKLALEGNGVAPQKATAIIVVTDDLLRFATAIATALINSELRTGVAAGTTDSLINNAIIHTCSTKECGCGTTERICRADRSAAPSGAALAGCGLLAG